MKIEFRLSQTPSLNELLHSQWGTTNWKAKFHRELKNAELLGNVVSKTKMFACIKIDRYGTRTIDHDNCVGGCKQLIDVLKEKGLIVDDSPEWIHVDYSQRKCERGQERTVVEIDWQKGLLK